MWRAIGLACLKREGLAFVALIALIVGAAVQTALITWLIPMLAEAGQWDAITNIALSLVATVAIVLFALTLCLGRRTLEVELWKLKAKMGNGETDA